MYQVLYMYLLFSALSTLHVLTQSSQYKYYCYKYYCYDISTIVMPVLQMRELR